MDRDCIDYWQHRAWKAEHKLAIIKASAISFVAIVAVTTNGARAMGDNVIGRVIDDIQTRIGDWWGALFDPIYVWYFWLAIFLIVVMVIAFFLQFKWIRAGLGFAVLIAIAFVAGGRQMSKSMRAKLNDAREKRKAAEDEARARGRTGDDSNSQGGGWSGGGGLFDWFK